MEFFKLDQLGEGAEASVYRAYSPDTERFYALKVPHLPWAPTSRLQIQNEGIRRIQARSPYIVNLIAWNLAGPEPFLALEYADGGTIGQAIEWYRGMGMRCDPKYALEIVRDVLYSLAVVHSRNVIHRDVKPENICRFSNGELALNDFGLGRTLSRPPHRQTKAIVGTPLYAAPEQQAGLGVDHRAESFEMCSTRWPWCIHET